MFKICLTILINGLHYTDKGYKFLLNANKYIANNLSILDLPWKEIDDILSQPSIFDTNLPYKTNIKNYTLSLKHNKSITSGVYIYDLNYNYIKTIGGQDKTAKYFNVSKYNILKHLNKDIPFMNKFYLKSSSTFKK